MAVSLLRILRLLERQAHEPIGPVPAVEVATGRDDLLELRRGDRQGGHDLANPSNLLVEVHMNSRPVDCLVWVLPSLVWIVMRGPKSVMVCDGMIVTRFMSSSTSGGSPAPPGSACRTAENPRFTTPYAVKYAVLPGSATVSSRRLGKAGLGYCVSSQFTTASTRSTSAGRMSCSSQSFAVTSTWAIL